MNRLEEVKRAWIKRDWDVLLDRKDIHWLIEQAEQIEHWKNERMKTENEYALVVDKAITIMMKYTKFNVFASHRNKQILRLIEFKTKSTLNTVNGKSILNH